MHTHILVQTSQFTFRAREPLRVGRLARTRRRPWHAHSHAVVCHRSLTANLCTSQISISRNSDARTHAASSRGGCACVSWRGKTPSLISCKPSASGLELRPRAHYVVYYLNTNALALALGAPRYHGKKQEKRKSTHAVAECNRVGLLEYFAEQQQTVLKLTGKHPDE